MATTLSLPARPRFPRSARDQVLTGVVGGLAERFQVEPGVARLLAVLLGLAGGAGVVVYLVAWNLSTEPDEAARVRPVSPRRTAAVAVGGLGVLLLLRRLDIWPGDGIMVPAIAIAAIAGLARARFRGSAPGLARGAMALPRLGPVRFLVGGLLAAGGAVFLLAGAGSVDRVRQEALSLSVALVGITIMLGPWIGRLVEQVDVERRERIRSEERAAMAAELHDSVLQTLVLIQRGADEPRRTVRLARHQERELRAWLYGDRRTMSGPESLPPAVELLAEEVETNHDVRVEAVVVGNHPLDEPARALLGAVREAVVNAARHAEVETIAVYVEAEDGCLTAYVRDRGRGFDPRQVPADRHGIANSIRGRVRRAGGEVTLVTAPGAGTEVQMRVPVSSSRREER